MHFESKFNNIKILYQSTNMRPCELYKENTQYVRKIRESFNVDEDSDVDVYPTVDDLDDSISVTYFQEGQIKYNEKKA